MGRASYKPTKEGAGALLGVSAFNNERAPMSRLQQLIVHKSAEELDEQ